MLQPTEKNFKGDIPNIFEDLKDNVCKMNIQIGNISTEIETINKSQMEILQLSRKYKIY